MIIHDIKVQLVLKSYGVYITSPVARHKSSWSNVGVFKPSVHTISAQAPSIANASFVVNIAFGIPAPTCLQLKDRKFRKTLNNGTSMHINVLAVNLYIHEKCQKGTGRFLPHGNVMPDSKVIMFRRRPTA